MAASLTPCFSNRGIALCSWTSCPLQNGHQSAERNKEKNGAFRSFQGIESLYPAKLIANRKSGSLLTDRESNGHELDGSHPNRIAIECPPDRHTISQVSGYRFLWLEAVHHPVRIVKQRHLRARHVL